jgi:phenylacetyl-CoA:acceptor oxidoreductase subunit 2
MLWMLLASGLLEGAGLLLLAALILPGADAALPLAAGAGANLALLNGALWWAYRNTARGNGIGPLARAELERSKRGLHLVAHILPAAGFIAVQALAPMPLVLAAVAGLAAAAGGAIWKFIVITRACHQQGFAFAKVPQRGSGSRAAPIRLGIETG